MNTPPEKNENDAQTAKEGMLTILANVFGTVSDYSSLRQSS